MKEIRGDMWKLAAQFDAVVITTNGFVKANGEAVMGRGCAKQAAQKFPDLPLCLGKAIRNYGNHVRILMRNPTVVAYPVKPQYVMFNGRNAVKHMLDKFKPGESVPGWASLASLPLIKQSAKELVDLSNRQLWQKIIMPRPGCGAGELEWETVKPILQKYLDDRFYVVTY